MEIKENADNLKEQKAVYEAEATKRAGNPFLEDLSKNFPEESAKFKAHLESKGVEPEFGKTEDLHKQFFQENNSGETYVDLFDRINSKTSAKSESNSSNLESQRLAYEAEATKRAGNPFLEDLSKNFPEESAKFKAHLESKGVEPEFGKTEDLHKQFFQENNSGEIYVDLFDRINSKTSAKIQPTLGTSTPEKVKIFSPVSIPVPSESFEDFFTSMLPKNIDKIFVDDSVKSVIDSKLSATRMVKSEDIPSNHADSKLKNSEKATPSIEVEKSQPKTQSSKLKNFMKMGEKCFTVACGIVVSPVIVSVVALGAIAKTIEIAADATNKAINLLDDKAMRNKFSSSLKLIREKAFGVSSENKLKM